MNELNIAWMYPDILNLHGDRGNIMAFERVGGLLGIKVNIQRIDKYNDPVNYIKTDIMFFNPGEVKTVPAVINALNTHREAFCDYAESGGTVICVASSGAVMANTLTRVDGTVIKGFGFLDMECRERETIYGDDIYFTVGNQEIIGCQIQMTDVKLTGADRLGELIYGMGNNEQGTKNEGARYKNVIFTNVLGPVFVKNPWFAESIIKTAMKRKGVTVENSVDPAEYEIELKSMECIKGFIKTAPKIKVNK